VGGPEVVAANGSRYMRMVTVKYSAGGAMVWTINDAGKSPDSKVVGEGALVR
jgi:hypothetical protein